MRKEIEGRGKGGRVSRVHWLLVIAFLFLISHFLLPTSTFAATYTVSNNGNTGAGTLRQAIIDANANAGADTINFTISSTTITPLTQFPALSDATGGTTIDATGQNITIDGNGASFNGFEITSANNTIKGLTIINFSVNPAVGIHITGASATNNTISGNKIGNDGTTAYTNYYGVSIGGGAQSNIIGGTTAGERNIISGNTSCGVRILGGGTNNNQVKGNYIGTDVNGTTAIANVEGIVIYNGAQSNIIGGTTAGERNIISGNDYAGIHIRGSNNNIIKGNFIGIDVNGTSPIPNGSGIYFSFSSGGSSNNTLIGGSSNGERNIISGNNSHGIYIYANAGTWAYNTVIKGNYIGTDINGSVAIPNGENGIHIRSEGNCYIGGTIIGTDGDGVDDATDGNIISGNTEDGIELEGYPCNCRIAGNFIGVDKNGTGMLPNGRNGIEFALIIDGWDIIIGTNNDGISDNEEKNVISGNGSHGIWIRGLWRENLEIRGNYIGVDISNSINLGNQGYGIGIDIESVTGSTIQDNIIRFNSKAGIYSMYMDESYTGYPDNIIDNNIISDNGQDLTADRGEGIYLITSSPTITNNTITNNRLDGILAEVFFNWDAYGDATYSDTDSNVASNEGLDKDIFSNPTITGNTINSNGTGISIYSIDNQPKLDFATLNANNTLGDTIKVQHDYYGFVRVLDESNSPVSGANVTVKDKDDNVIASGVTGTYGYYPQQDQADKVDAKKSIQIISEIDGVSQGPFTITATYGATNLTQTFTYDGNSSDLDANDWASSDERFQIAVLGGDITPPSDITAVNDGTGADITYTTSTTQLSANWTASSDAQSGVVKYWYAIGTTAGGTNVVSWTDNGLNLSVTKTGLSLTNGQIYYFSVKAENGAGLQSTPTNSNGQTVDATIPTIDSLSSSTHPTQTDWYSNNLPSLNWTGSGGSSGLAGYYYLLDQTSTQTNTYVQTNGTFTTSTSYTYTTAKSDGVWYFHIIAKNNLDVLSDVSDYTVKIDVSPPSDITTVNDGTGADIQWTVVSNQLSVNWTASTDGESGIAKYYYAIGTTAGGTNVVSWTDNGLNLSVTKTGLSLTNGQIYYFTVKAENGAGLMNQTPTSSDGQTVDNTPPSNTATVNDGTGADITYTTSTTQLSANWTASTDGESGIAKYYYAIGTTAGGTDVVGWTDNGLSTSVTKIGLTLTNGTTYYFSVKAENGAGLQSSVKSSDGVLVDAIIPVLTIETKADPTSTPTRPKVKITVKSSEQLKEAPIVIVTENETQTKTTVTMTDTGNGMEFVGIFDIGSSDVFKGTVYAEGYDLADNKATLEAPLVNFNSKAGQESKIEAKDVGVNIYIPSDALTQDTQIVVSTTGNEATSQNIELGKGGKEISIETSTSQVLISDATITLSYAGMTNIQNENKLRIYNYDETTQKWKFIESDVNATAKEVSAKISHFSKYALFGDNTVPIIADLTVKNEVSTGTIFTITANVTDMGSGIDTTSFVAKIGGNTIPSKNYTFSETSGAFSCYITNFLSTGEHIILLGARDKTGNKTEVSNAFKVKPANISILFNYPNPFSFITGTKIRIETDAPIVQIMVDIYTISGEKIKVLNTLQDLGGNKYEVSWDGRDDGGRVVANGVYIYRVTIVDISGQEKIATKKLAVIK